MKKLATFTCLVLLAASCATNSDDHAPPQDPPPKPASPAPADATPTTPQAPQANPQTGFPPLGGAGASAAGTSGQDPQGQGQPDKANEDKAWNDAFKTLQGTNFSEFAELVKVKAQSESDKAARVNSLEGFNFGTGIGATFDLHGGSRISSAALVDDGTGQKTVRVDNQADAGLGLILETHYFWVSEQKLVGWGPFFAIKTSDTDLIDQAGLGFMVGLRRDKESTNSFNIGLGIMLDPDARVLADGFAPNLAPPTGSADVRYKTEERFSLALVFSYTF